MKHLLILACSAQKRVDAGLLPAIERCDGYSIASCVDGCSKHRQRKFGPWTFFCSRQNLV
ncbi:hypothetical protein HRbin15_01129 [bacterium HR15]|nr:hypothetical protein HRbin15_01129 [bacterium HR15]